MGFYDNYMEEHSLFHSDEYLGSDYSDGLQHYKYIKRYRGSNGKWRYVYAKKDVHDSISRKKQAAELERDNAYRESQSEKSMWDAYNRLKNIGENSALKTKAYNSAMEHFRNKYENKRLAEQSDREADELIENNSISKLLGNNVGILKKKIKDIF